VDQRAVAHGRVALAAAWGFPIEHLDTGPLPASADITGEIELMHFNFSDAISG